MMVLSSSVSHSLLINYLLGSLKKIKSNSDFCTFMIFVCCYDNEDISVMGKGKICQNLCMYPNFNSTTFRFVYLVFDEY